VLIQEFIVGDEVSVPIINGEILPIMSLVKNTHGAVFDYNSKYENQLTMKEEFDILPKNIKEDLEKISQKIFTTFGCKDIARIDFIVREGTAYFLEINTIP
jgi:D-alanine-D-alanine ligase